MAEKAIGTKLIFPAMGSEVDDFVVAHLTSIGEQTTERDEEDVTCLDSVDENGNPAKEFDPGVPDSGSIDFEYREEFDGQTTKLKAIFNANQTRKFKVIYPDNKGGFRGKGYISSFANGEATPDGRITKTFTLRITGGIKDWEGIEPAENPSA